MKGQTLYIYQFEKSLQLVAVIMASSSANGPTDEAAAVEAEDVEEEQSSPEIFLPRHQDIEHIWNTATTFKEFAKRVSNIDADKLREREEEINARLARKRARRAKREEKAAKKLAKHPEKKDKINAELAKKIKTIMPFIPGRVPGQQKNIEEKRKGPVPPGPVKPGPR